MLKKENVTYALENMVLPSASREISLCYIQDETRLDKKSHSEGEQNVTHARQSSSSKMIGVKAFYSYSVHVCVFVLANIGRIR